MPNRNSIILMLALSIVVWPGAATAAPLGRSFTYQGQLQQSGVPVEGTVSLRFSLWDAAGSGEPPTGGTMIGVPQVVANAPVSAGVFSVGLNGNDEFGPQAFNGEARWLQVEVCTDSTCASAMVLGPRQPVTGAPYSLGPWQTNGTSLHYSAGKVGIGTASPAHALHIRTYQPALVLEDTAIASQQSGYISFQNGTSETGWMGYGSAGSPDMTLANARSSGDIVLWAAGEKLRVDSGGNVGIGTSTPASRLEVRGDVRLGSVGQYFAPSSGENLRIIRGKVSSTGAVLFGSGFTASRSATGAYTITFTTAFPAGQFPIVTASAESNGTVARIAMVNTPSHVSAPIKITNGSATAVDCDFYFIAVGPR